MIQVRNTIKLNFKTGDYPNQQAFWDWIDSFIHRTEDSIEMQNVKGLIDAMNSKADQQAFQQLYNLFQQLPDTYATKDHTHTFESITDKPITLAGYGIADAYTKDESDSKYAPISHDHQTNEIEDFETGVVDVVNLIKDIPNGVPGLDDNGKLSNSVLPPLSTTEVYPIASEAEMLALNAERGDFAVRTDSTPATVFILVADDASVLANWLPVSTAGGILTVNGKSGPSVQLTTSDIPEGAQKYFTTALARGVFSPGYGIQINASGQISNTLTSLNAVTNNVNANTTQNAIRISGNSNYPTSAGKGLVLSYDTLSDRATIYSHEEPAAWKGLEITADHILFNRGTGGSIYMGYQQPEEAPTNTMLAVNGKADFKDNVSGIPATAPEHFTTLQQLNDQFSQGSWTPIFHPNVENEVTVRQAYYYKTGKNVRVIGILDFANPTYANVVEILGLPYSVVNWGPTNYFKSFWGTSFADSTTLPQTANKKLDLCVQAYRITGGMYDTWDTLKNKTVYFDITYITD
jgi:hypothetical protein